jgi:serine/threonine-protein kinase
MERIHGDTLGQLLSKERNLSLREVAELIDQISEVLDETRKQGIVHRDIKPQNILLAHESKTRKVWKLLDFGVATLGETTGTLTQGGVIGTPAYMAPEQARGEKVDYRADLYALCAVAYRCVLRRPAFRGKDVGPVLYQVVHDMPVLPSAIGDFRSESVGKSMDEFFAIGLAKGNEERFVSAADMAGSFRRALKGTLPIDLKNRAKRLLRDYPFNDPNERARRLREAMGR